MKQRIESLDWLRGLMAISIMFYHIWGWAFFELTSNSILGRLGVYGVSVFFILSGLSMAIVYSNYINNLKKAVFFFVRRIFRIWPLLWVCIGLVTISSIAFDKNISIIQILLNMTTLFGFVNPTNYINGGAWSIGNEMVYYAFTPLVISLYNRKLIIGNIFLFSTFVISMIFAFYLLKINKSLADQWSIYVNPFNNLFLYVAGIGMYYNFKEKVINQKINILLMSVAVVLFIVYPVTGNQINVVVGFNRLFFILISLILVFSFYKFTLYNYMPKILSIPLKQFGVATYGVYLLHPIVYMYLGYIFDKIGIKNIYIHITCVIICTIITALLSYNIFESKFMKIGKEITTSDNKNILSN